MLARSSRLISSLRALDKVHMKYNENVGCACIPWGNFARTRYYSKRRWEKGEVQERTVNLPFLRSEYKIFLIEASPILLT